MLGLCRNSLEGTASPTGSGLLQEPRPAGVVCLFLFVYSFLAGLLWLSLP